MTESKDNNKIINSDSQTVTEVTTMTLNELKELVNEVHSYKVTPPRENYKYWSTNLPKVEGDPIRGKVTGKTEQELYEKLAKYYGIHIVNEDATLEDMFYTWYDQALEDGMERQTYERYEYSFKKYYVKTNWSKRKIKRLSETDWLYFVENTVKDKIYPTRGERLTKRQYRDFTDITSSILAQGKRDGLITYEWGSKGTKSGIAYLINLNEKAFLQTPKKDDVYYPNEMKKILEYCEAHSNPKTNCIRLMAITGMRVGEAVCICHEDIDLHSMTISVNKTEIKTKNGTHVQHHTKTDAGMRTVYLKKCHKEFLSELYFKSSVNPFVFINEKKNKKGKNGRIGSQAIRRYLKEICESVGVTYKGSHAIRKYYASVLKLNKVPDEIRKSLLGHKDIDTTEKKYDRNLFTAEESIKELEKVSGI